VVAKHFSKKTKQIIASFVTLFADSNGNHFQLL